MEEISWGGLFVTLLLPLFAVIWMMLVLRRKALMTSPAEPYSRFARGSAWVAGFIITWAFATFLGFYLLAQIGSGTTDTSMGLTVLTGIAPLYIAGLWGALVPFRMLAREGKVSVLCWLISALAYALLYYLTTTLFF